MKKTYRITTRLAVLAIFAFSISSCGNSNPDHISNYTPGNNADSANVSNGIDKTVRGKELFQQRCIACHGLSGNYRNNNAADLSVSRIDSLSIVSTIRNGRGAMPISQAALSDSDIAQVELYVKTLRKN